MSEQAFNTTQYLATILPQAKQQRRAAEATKRTFYEQVKRYVANQGLPARDYEIVLRAVCDAMNF